MITKLITAINSLKINFFTAYW